MKNFGIVLVSVFAGAMLLACVTEEGTKRHIAQMEEASSGNGQGMAMVHWQGIVYMRPGSRVPGKEIGMFRTRDDCAKHSKQHIQAQKMSEGIFACQRVDVVREKDL